MWNPTHVQVTVQRARGLVAKGNNGVFVTIGLGKDKYQTSEKERTGNGGGDEIEWREKCELKIPSQGNTASICLTVLTHNVLGLDNFLGCVNIPLCDLDVYDRPKNKWYELQDKQGKPRHKDRGELEVKIGFLVKPGANNGNEGNGGGGSVGVTAAATAAKKDSRRGSLTQLTQVAHNVGGSLASIGSVDKKSFKKLAKTITKKIKKDKKLFEEESAGGLRSSTPNLAKKFTPVSSGGQIGGDADPGVVSDEDEFAFDDLSHTGSGCSLEVAQATNNSGLSATGSNRSIETVASSDIPSSGGGQYKESPSAVSKFNTLPSSKSSARSVTPIQEKFALKWEQKFHEAKKTKAMLNKSSERIVVGGEAKSVSPAPTNRLSPEVLRRYEGKTREDLIEMVQQLQNSLNRAEKERKDLEDYIDNLLLRVMERSPNILQNPYAT